jgi:hypothetical protein
MRRVVVALALAAGLTLLAPPVNAQNYPPGTSPGLTVSASRVPAGGRLMVSGGGARPGAAGTITLAHVAASLGSGEHAVASGPVLVRRVAAASRPLAQSTVVVAHTTAAGDGSFQTQVTMPSGLVSGVYTLSAVSGGEVLSVATIRVIAASDGLPFTGADVGPGLAVGAGLIVAGGLLLLAIRRRRRSTA